MYSRHEYHRSELMGNQFDRTGRDYDKSNATRGLSQGNASKGREV